MGLEYNIIASNRDLTTNTAKVVYSNGTFQCLDNQCNLQITYLPECTFNVRNNWILKVLYNEVSFKALNVNAGENIRLELVDGGATTIEYSTINFLELIQELR